MMIQMSPDDFLDAAVPKPQSMHREGNLIAAKAMLRKNPKLVEANVFTAAVTGNLLTVWKQLARGERGGKPKGKSNQFSLISSHD